MAGERAGESEIGMASSLFFLGCLQALDFALNHQLFIAAERHAMLLGKTLRALADEINMRALVEHQPGSADGVANALHAPNATSAERCPIHHEGVELNPAVAGEKAASASVKGFIIFHADDGCFH